MKTASLIFSVILMLVMVTSTVSLAAEPASATLDEAVQRLSEALRNADRALVETARVVGKGLEGGTSMRANVRNLCQGSEYAIDCSFLNAKGIVEIMEPEKYRKFEGSNLAAQAVTAQMLRQRKPIFSELFVGIEEMQAALFAYPVLNTRNEYVGSVNLLFHPDSLARQALKGMKTGKGTIILILQSDGTHVFSSDPAQMRRNVLKSAEYQAFPELKGMVGQIVSKEAGAGSYRYVKPGTQQVVKKRAAWKTVSLYDGFWRVVVTEPEKP